MKEKIIKDIEARCARVESWEKRFNKLLKQKDKNKEDFCTEHGIYLSWLVRAMQINPLPTWRSIAKVEAALEKEGV